MRRLIFGLTAASYALLSWKLPLWDDDFTSWILPGWTQSLGQVLWNLFSPISTQSQHWGFNDRPLELLHYKLGYALSGWDGWGYWLQKSLWMGGLMAGLYTWMERLDCDRRVSLLLLLFLASAPPTTAAFLWHADFAPAAECLFVWLAGAFYDLARQPSGPGWTRKALLLTFLTYLSYKSKADLKLLPAILTGYLALSGNRRRWLLPLGLMLLLAVPWGPSMLQPRRGAAWMWQLPDLRHLGEFFWSSLPFRWTAPTMSLAALTGPFLLLALPLGRPRRMRLLLLWLAADVLALSVLPVLNYTFRIRYALLPLVPLTLLLAGWLAKPRYKPVVMLLLLLQIALNGVRSYHYWQDLGGLIVVVDRVWTSLHEQHPNDSLALIGVLPFAYRPDQAPILQTKASVPDFPQMGGRKFAASWLPTLWEEVELVRTESAGLHTMWLYRYIGPDPLWKEQRYADFLSKYPGSQAAQFALAFQELQLEQWQAADRRLETLEKQFPDNRAVLYNRAFARQHLGDFRGAIQRYERLARDGNDAGIRYNLELCRKSLLLP